MICGSPNTWRHKLRLTWSSPWDVELSFQWRHFGGVNLDANTANPLANGVCGGPCGDLADAHIPSIEYFDVSGGWTVRDGIDIRFGVNNIFDKEPPVIGSDVLGLAQAAFGTGNTFANFYDSLGRTIFIGATIRY